MTEFSLVRKVEFKIENEQLLHTNGTLQSVDTSAKTTDELLLETAIANFAHSMR